MQQSSKDAMIVQPYAILATLSRRENVPRTENALGTWPAELKVDLKRSQTGPQHDTRMCFVAYEHVYRCAIPPWPKSHLFGILGMARKRHLCRRLDELPRISGISVPLQDTVPRPSLSLRRV